MAADPNTVRGRRDPGVPGRHYWDQYRTAGPASPPRRWPAWRRWPTSSHHRPLGFINPFYYRLLGTSSLHDIVAPTSPLAQVRTDYVNFLDNTQGKFFRLQTIDVQSSTLHDTPGYDDETGVGTPQGPAFFLSALHH